MLSPTDRRLLLDALSPPERYTLDHALGTTYTLDLLALLRVPLAATALPWSERDGGPVNNPYALLTALRRNAARVSLYCHAGETAVPAKHVPLLAFLEDSVHPVTPPRDGGVFHPKIWVLRFAPELDGDPFRYRLLVLSRNLTFDRSWDVVLVLDGELEGRRDGASRNGPLAEFIEALPRMASAAGQPVPEPAAERATLLAREVRQVRWDLPEDFSEIAFHPIGHDGRPAQPIERIHRLLVIAPYVDAAALTELAENVEGDLQVIGRFEELLRLDPDELPQGLPIHVFDDAAAQLDAEDQQVERWDEREGESVDLLGLHAKVFVGHRSRRSVVYLGSANATRAAFERNVEFLVELEGSRKKHGIDAVRKALDDANLLTVFKPGAPPEHSEVEGMLERRLKRVAHALAAGGLRAHVEPAGDDRWRTTLHSGSDVALDGFRVWARPLSDQSLRAVDLSADPACTFPPTGRSSITAFFALRISGRAEGVECHFDTTVRLPLDGAPNGRVEAVTAELLADRERLLRFILLLLADDGQASHVLEGLPDVLGDPIVGDGAPTRTAATDGLPLLEPMLRALHRSPERIDEIDRLLRDVRAAGMSTGEVLPPELEQLWDAVRAVREELR